MINKIAIAISCFVALLFASCTEVESGMDAKSSITLSDEMEALFSQGLDIPATGGSQELSFYASEAWEFTTTAVKSESPDWCRVSPSSGEPGQVECTVELDPNTTSEDRSLSLQLLVGTELISMDILQEASDSFFITGSTFNVSAEGETISVIASSNVEYEITIDSSSSWITEVVAKASVVESEHTFAIAANDSGEQRVGYIDFTTAISETPERVTITQLQNNIYILSEPSYTLDPTGETIDVVVSANIDFEVELDEQSYPWIREVVAKGVVDTTLQFEIAAYDEGTPRTGYIYIRFEGDILESVTITQMGTKYIIVTPSSYEASAIAGEEFEIEVDSSVEYTVSEIPASCTWLSRVDNGSDATLLKFLIEEGNAFEQREVILTLSAEDVEDVELKITQAILSGKRELYLFDPYPTEAGYPQITINPVLVENSSNRINFIEYGANADGETYDGELLNKAISDVSADPDGGIVYLPKADYALYGVILKSNVHLHIEEGAKLVLPERNYTGNKTLFTLGENGDYATNVLISGVTNGYFDIKTNGRFDIDLITHGAEDLTNTDANASPRTIKCQNVHHFYVGNINVYDQGTEMAHVTFSPNEAEDAAIFGPTNGVIQNISSYGCHYGYGTIQAQAAKQIYFNNLYGEGGVVLRFETGLNSMNTSQFGGVFDCKGYDISGIDGNATVMISPHAMHNGIVQVSKISAVSMSIGVRLDAGYNYTDDYGVVHGGGEYTEGSYVSDITCTFGTTAQVKSKHLTYMPSEIKEMYASSLTNYYTYEYATTDNTRTTPYYYPAPSVCSVLLTASIPTNFIAGGEDEIVGTGYQYFDNDNGFYDAR
ncbi:MAG: BACON domain-containing carbohydrate-binding protein [Rikenellaceae bacterium]